MMNGNDFQIWLSSLSNEGQPIWTSCNHEIWMAIQRSCNTIILNYKCHSKISELPIKSIRISMLTGGGGKLNFQLHGLKSYSASGTINVAKERGLILYMSDKIVIDIEEIAMSDVSIKIQGECPLGNKWVRRAKLCLSNNRQPMT